MIRLFQVAMNPAASSLVSEVLESGYIGQGPKVEQFEQAFGELVDAPYPPLSVNCCTSGLDLALHLIGVSFGDEVISTPMTCTATNSVIVRRGADIVWADIDPESGLIDPEDVRRKFTRKTKAIMAVDWGGMPCDYMALKQFGIPVIEDAAHSLLAKYRGASIARTGGDYICWSFQAIKHLTTGDGGALLTPADRLERGRLLRWYGLDRRSNKSFRCEQDIAEVGYKYQMNDIAAAIGLSNLTLAEENVAKHRANAMWFHEHLIGLKNIALPCPDPGSSWWLYTVRVKERDAFSQFMAERGIETSPVHARNDKHSAFAPYRADLPGLDVFASEEVAIPVGWWVTDEDRERIASSVKEWSEAAFA